jgi:hypothetical protein
VRLERHAEVRGQIASGLRAEDGNGLYDEFGTRWLAHVGLVVGVVIGAGAAGHGVTFQAASLGV